MAEQTDRDRAKTDVWGPIAPYGIPGPAGKGPTPKNTTGTDDSGKKA